jgi:GDPmannose 4,6-dehydratase
VSLIREILPDEVYNLAAISDVATSFSSPFIVSQVDGVAVVSLLEGIKALGSAKTIKFYQASTSEMFGETAESPQTESTRFNPRSPYAISKLFAYWTVVNYREAYDVFAVNGILFNHESPRRAEHFVTQKIIAGLARNLVGVNCQIYLGNLDAKRDWGHAKDYVRAMWLMLQTDIPDDFVIATGKQFSVREFVSRACKCASLTIEWRGEGMDEVGVVNGKVVVVVDPINFRPTEVPSLMGCSRKAEAKLGWWPSIDLDELIREMLESELRALGSNVLVTTPMGG